MATRSSLSAYVSGTLALALLVSTGCEEPPKPPPGQPSDQSTSLEKLVPHASGVSLAEIVEVKRIDERPSDGSLYDRVKLRTHESSGMTLDELHVFIEHGGHGPTPGGNTPPEPLIPLGSLKVGAKFWLVTYFPTGEHAYTGNNPEFVVKAWPADDPAGAICRAAIAADMYAWNPQYDRDIKVSLGHRIDKPGEFFTIRISQDGQELWQQKIEGTKSQRYASWGLWAQGHAGMPSQMPESGKLVIVETAQALDKDNEFELEPKTYYIKYAFDPFSGVRRAVWISRHQDGQVDELFRDYTAEGELTRELRVERDGEQWLRYDNRFDANEKQIESKRFRFDPASGKYFPDDQADGS